jgi:hypothetical protein
LSVLLLAFALSTRDSTFGLPVSLIWVAQFLGPINIVLLSCCIWTAVVSDLVVFSRRTRVPAIVLLAILAIVLGTLDLNNNHVIRRSPTFNRSVELDDAFGRWLAQRPDRTRFDVYPVVLVTAEGGGIRAAFFTALVLARMIDACPQMAQHIFAISAVSGGSVGAAVYAAAMKAKPPDTTLEPCDFRNTQPTSYQDAITTILSDDHLSPLLARLLFPEAVQHILPYPVAAFDRQLGLEYSLERSFLRAFGIDLLADPLYALMPSFGAPTIPYLFLNTTRVRDGRRIIMSPIYVKTVQHGGFDDWHLIDYLNGPPLSAAAGTSARFPFISPPGSFTSLNVKRDKEKVVQDHGFKGQQDEYVDGGYFDNSGAPTLAEIYRQLHEIRTTSDRRGISDQRFSVHIVHIGNAPICDNSSTFTNSRPCKPIGEYKSRSGLWSEAVTAVETVINVRDSRVDYGLRQLQEELNAVSQPKTDQNIDPRGLTEAEILKKAEDIAKVIEETEPYTLDRYSTIQMRDQGTTVPLGWLLSRRAVEELKSQLKPLDEKVCERDRSSRFRSFAECELAELLSDFAARRKGGGQ